MDTHALALAAQSLLRPMHRIDFARGFRFTHGWLPTVVLPGIAIGLRGAQNLPDALPEIELSSLLGALAPVARP